MHPIAQVVDLVVFFALLWGAHTGFLPALVISLAVGYFVDAILKRQGA